MSEHTSARGAAWSGKLRRVSDRGRGLQQARFLHPSTPFDHDITISPELCEEYIRGAQTHLIQHASSHFGRGQVIRLRGFDRTMERFTGHVLYARITAVTDSGAMGLPVHLVVMSVRLIGMIDREKFPSMHTAKPPVLLHLLGKTTQRPRP
ncbi:DUF3850 domain-containing protein [Curvibacter sp. APW13]|uniref:DUF3850 domain-containing protein n=1 Tax=Curvibacter sp. APW13 TaxID=3077236 RepID=UPI0028DE5C16|nr:DUF3850 domain-containing protein [Curvibacter sp. APW13]MDT8992889.1 DUF3850 domain-containing protein [Curvibacter sp. APW13]